MPTKRELINGAFSKVGITQYNFEIAPEQMQEAREVLDDYMAEMSRLGMVFDPVYPPDGDLESETNAPEWTVRHLKNMLAVEVAPIIGRTPMPKTNADANTSLDTMLTQYMVHYSPDIGGMITGAGRKRSNYPFIRRGEENPPYVDPAPIPPPAETDP